MAKITWKQTGRAAKTGIGAVVVDWAEESNFELEKNRAKRRAEYIKWLDTKEDKNLGEDKIKQADEALSVF